MVYIKPLKPGLELLNDKARLIKDLEIIYKSYSKELELPGISHKYFKSYSIPIKIFLVFFIFLY